ncbi:MAG TPA: asparaginase [Pyrinomonadaceae bacterium]|jgi:L-asparaginase II
MALSAQEGSASSARTAAADARAHALTVHAAQPAPLVVVTRGALGESWQRGHLCVVDGAGTIIAQLGTPDATTFLRSAAKPVQAIPLVTTGAADRFDFDARELAVTCGSHNGEPAHVETVRAMLQKIGLDESALRCGPHEPYSRAAAEALQRAGAQPRAVHNNCSGKHAGMLALARHLGAPTQTYDHPDSPVQRAIKQQVAQFTDLNAGEIICATDGCGVPTCAVPVAAMALMAARLVNPPAAWEAKLRAACRRLVAAMTTHPDMVEGAGELDTELMRRAGGRLVSKVGAEGIYVAGLLPCERWPRGLGLAFKLEDGDKQDRARPIAAVAALSQLGLFNDQDLAALGKFAHKPITNHRGERVGEVRAVFSLPLL